MTGQNQDVSHRIILSLITRQWRIGTETPGHVIKNWHGHKVYYVDMEMANIAELKNKLSKFLSIVERGEKVAICKRNIPVAHLIPVKTKENKNHTQLG